MMAVIRGCDGYFGYPITPQSEVIETLAELKPWETTGMQVVQAESELASIYMVYGEPEIAPQQGFGGFPGGPGRPGAPVNPRK